MALIDEIKTLCDKLANNGWDKLFDQFGMKIKSNSTLDLKSFLEDDITIPDTNVGNPAIFGFEDVPLGNLHGITQGDPARSLLYHALASPSVISTEAIPLTYFPTLAEIELVENYVYGINLKSIDEILDSDLGDEFAVVVFAYEYRTAQNTPHKNHADMCYSRTGISRVGTTEPHYDKEQRGFVPHVDTDDVHDDDHVIRVLPSRYAAFIAVKNTKKRISPMSPQIDDLGLDFWIPIHKLFDGDECIAEIPLNISLNTLHVNEKIKRIHKEFSRLDISNQYTDEILDKTPFTFTDGIAEFSKQVLKFGKHLLVPFQNNLIDVAKDEDNKNISFKVPLNHNRVFSTSLLIDSVSNSDDTGELRHAPEYVNVRHEIDDGAEINLNNTIDTISDLQFKVSSGDYDALHYVDYTGDGWIKSEYNQELKIHVPISLPAYSLVSAPDFFPYADQHEIFEWSKSLSKEQRDEIWRTDPVPLSDMRIAPNFELPNSSFDFNDKTFTAIVSSSKIPDVIRNFDIEKIPHTHRHRWLPDGAAGVFAPGWDISVDSMVDDDTVDDDDDKKNIVHLAAYGLGSPFPEDAKLCALLSTFWPAASPDIARTFDPFAGPVDLLRTVSPLTDDELGLTDKPSWDGIVGPKKLSSNTIEFPSLEHADYVDSALNKKFSLALTSKVDFVEYTRRALNMNRVYHAISKELPLEFQNLQNSKRFIRVLSFTKLDTETDELTQAQTDELKKAQNDSKSNLDGVIYRLEMFVSPGLNEIQPEHESKRHIEVVKSWIVFAGDNDVLIKPDDGIWISDSKRND